MVKARMMESGCRTESLFDESGWICFKMSEYRQPYTCKPDYLRRSDIPISIAISAVHDDQDCQKMSTVEACAAVMGNFTLYTSLPLHPPHPIIFESVSNVLWRISTLGLSINKQKNKMHNDDDTLSGQWPRQIDTLA